MRRESRLAALLWLPVNAVQGLFTLLWTAVGIPIALAVALVARRPAPALWIARRVWAPGLVWGAGARLRVSGAERLDLSRPALFVANHQSWIDIPALFMALPVPLRFLAKRELAGVPLLGAYIRAMGMVFIDRDNARRARASVDCARRRARARGPPGLLSGGDALARRAPRPLPQRRLRRRARVGRRRGAGGAGRPRRGAAARRLPRAPRADRGALRYADRDRGPLAPRARGAGAPRRGRGARAARRRVGTGAGAGRSTARRPPSASRAPTRSRRRRGRPSPSGRRWSARSRRRAAW